MQTAQQLLERLYPQRRSLLKRQILLDALSCFLEYGLDATSIEMIRDKSESSVGAILKIRRGLLLHWFLLRWMTKPC